MFQVNTGKFFKSEERIRTDAKATLYSNYRWASPIQAGFITLTPKFPFDGPVSEYEITYVNQVEKYPEPMRTLLAALPDDVIVEQFNLICTFGLRAFFHTSKEVVAITCPEKGGSGGQNRGPSAFIPRVLAPEIVGTQQEVDEFVLFVDKVIGLPRAQYKDVILSLRNFSYALRMAANNLDISYAMFVFCLDGLAQRQDAYVPKWEHYQARIRDPLEGLFSDSSSPSIDQVKEVLLKDANLKTTRRFIDFGASHLNDAFFLADAPAGRSALRKGEVEHALENAYSFRSKYAHELKPLIGLLKFHMVAQNDVARMSNQTYLTLNGIRRVTHSAISEFIRRQRSVDTEDIAWEDENPNVIQVPIAPNLWVHRLDGLTADLAPQRLSGHMEELELHFLNSSEKVTNLKDVLSAFQPLYDKARANQQRAILALHTIYSSHSEDDDLPVTFSEFMEPRLQEINKCSVESMLVRLEIGGPWYWPVGDCQKAWDSYLKQKFRKLGLHLPPVCEIAMQVELARKHLESGDTATHRALIDEAIRDAAGWPNIQRMLLVSTEFSERINFYEMCLIAKGETPTRGA